MRTVEWPGQTGVPCARLMQPCIRRRNKLPLAVARSVTLGGVVGAEKSAAPDALKNRVRLSPTSTCDKAAAVPAVMLHLRARYVSKAAILTVPAQPCRPKIEVPLEFQGLGSLGAASWRRFFPCEFDSNKERARGCRKSVRFGSVRSLRNGLVRTGAR